MTARIRRIPLFLPLGLIIFAARAGGQGTEQTRPEPLAASAQTRLFRDCPDCPEMVVVPPGDFKMGSDAAEKSWATSHGSNPESVADESPQHQASVRSFALGKYDVTRAEYAVFVHETGYPAGDGCYESSMPKANKRADANWQNPGPNQSERDPVTCVSWKDAQAYISWLNEKAGQTGSASGEGRYRLPSEAEWEYAARAGSVSRFWWGDDDGRSAQYAWFKDNSGGHSHPVGSKPANRFGLYDMVGNVWQWTQDCYAESYADAPKDGRAYEAGRDCLRVDRGGSWLYPAWLLRSATRERNPADYRDIIMGFRVAKTLPEKTSGAATSTTQAERPTPPFGDDIKSLGISKQSEARVIR
jgi:formylglycine-generating enzyme required for sulfatase activity